MLQTEGWEIAERFINSRIDDHRKQLEYCQLEDVPKHRHMIQAYQSITTHINEQIAKAE